MVAKVAAAAIAESYANHPQQMWVEGARSRDRGAETVAPWEPRVSALETAVAELTARMKAQTGAAEAKAPRQIAEERLLQKKWGLLIFEMRLVCGGMKDVAALEADLKMRFEVSMGLEAGAIEASAALQHEWSKAWITFLKACAENEHGDPSCV